MTILAAAKQYGYADRFQIIAALLVIAIHTGPLTTYKAYGDFLLTSIIARVAVPFFFIIAAFFLFKKLTGKRKQDKEIVRQYIGRIAKLYLLAIIIYLPVNIYSGKFETDFTLIQVLQDILWNGTMYHLWYFPALITGIFLIAYLYHRIPFSAIFVISGLLYVIGLLGDSYYGVAQQSDWLLSIYESLFSIFDYTRNGFFFAPIYIVLGAWLAKRPDRIFHTGTSGGLVIVCFVFLILEGVLLAYFDMPRHDSMYIMLIPVVYFLTQFLLGLQAPGHLFLRKLSTWVYILHPLMIIAVRATAKLLNLTEQLVENSIIHFVAVSIVSFAISALICMVTTKKKDKSIKKRRAWTEINLHYLQQNIEELKHVIPKSCSIMAVVKADAYGHGSVEVVRGLQNSGIERFAVAELGEAIELRKNGIKSSILILGRTDESRFEELVRYKLMQTVVDFDYGQLLDAYGKKITVHVKIDTGMGRLGESYTDYSRVKQIYLFKNLNIVGTFSHLSSADKLDEQSIAFTHLQKDRFFSLIEQLRKDGVEPGAIHLQGSYGILNYPDIDCDLVRPGIALFGMEDRVYANANLLPVLSLKAMVTKVRTVESGTSVGYNRIFEAKRKSIIATVSIGYADGVSRQWSEAGCEVLVKGKRASIAGTICMDQLMVDVTHIDEVVPGDIVTLIGRDGDEKITVEQVAARCNTIANEIFCRLSKRVERIYVER